MPSTITMAAQFILERQRTGLEAAKAKGGVYKPSVPIDEVRRLSGERKGRGLETSPRRCVCPECPGSTCSWL
jgi:hypothetical protein